MLFLFLIGSELDYEHLRQQKGTAVLTSGMSIILLLTMPETSGRRRQGRGVAKMAVDAGAAKRRMKCCMATSIELMPKFLASASAC